MPPRKLLCDHTWCPTCKRFQPGRGPCPECGDSRRCFEPVSMPGGDWKDDVRGRRRRTPE